MRSFTIWALSWRNLMRRKSRTFLTVFSVMIGAISIVMMLSFGYAIQRNTQQQLESFVQMTTITVRPQVFRDPMEMQQNPGLSTKGMIDDKVVDQIRQLDHVKAVLPTKDVQFELGVEDRELEIWTMATAVDFSQLSEDQVELVEGRLPQNGRKDEILLSKDLDLVKVDKKTHEFTPAEADVLKLHFYLKSYMTGDPSQIQIGQEQGAKLDLEPVGIYAKSELLPPRGLFLSMDTLERMQKKEEDLQKKESQQAFGQGGQVLGPKEGPAYPNNRPKSSKRYYDMVLVQADEMENAKDIVSKIQDDLQLQAYADTDFIQGQAQAMRTVQLIFGGLGSIALFVSAIGIANTMLMSIQERMREIGVMKVIGAQVRDIRRIFLTEASLIGFVGGLFGSLVSLGLSLLINHYGASYMQNEMGGMGDLVISYIPPWLPLAALVFSALVGLVSGYLPARRATKISAIEAIRSE